MTRPGRLLAAGLLLMSAVMSAVMSTAPAASAVVDGDQPTAQVTLTALGPAVVDPRATLTATGTITNIGAEALQIVTARLRLVRDPLGTPAAVAAWDDGGDERTGTVVGPTLDPLPSIAVGASAPFTLTVAAADLGLAGQRFSAYGLAVEVRAQGGLGRRQVGLLRTTVQWQPGPKEFNAQQLAWLVPITGVPTGVNGADPSPAQLAAAVGPDSRLRRLLDAASAPGVGWAVDPALLQALGSTTPSASASGATATPTASTPAGTPDAAASRAVATFVADLRSAAVGRVVIELPYGDPDLAAVTARGRADLVRAAQAAGAGIVEQVLGVTPVTGVAWPADGWATDTTLRELAAIGVSDAVLDARSRRLVDVLPYTPDARTHVAPGLTGWLADPVLGTLAASRASGVLPVQRVLAETAAVTSERPGLTRRLLVALPRGLDPDPAAFRALVRALSSVPWVSVVPATDLRRNPPGSGSDGSADLPRLAAPAPAAVSRAQLSNAHVAAVRRTRSVVSALGEVVADPVAVTSGLQRSTLTLLSCSWRGRPADLAKARGAVAGRVRTLGDHLRVLPSSVNFLASSGRLQITIINELPEAVAGLRLRVTSTNPRLRVTGGDVPAPDLAPGTRAQVQVPVQALGKGTVRLDAQLVSPSGRPLGQRQQVSVRAQPTGTWALGVVGAVVGLVLVVGLVRALRRPRRRPAKGAGA